MRGYSKLDDIEYKVFNKGVSCKKHSVFERFPIGILAYTEHEDSIKVYCRIISRFLHPHQMPDLISGITLPESDEKYHFMCIVPKNGFGLKLMRIKFVVSDLDRIYDRLPDKTLVFHKDVSDDKAKNFFLVIGLNEDNKEKIMKEYDVTYPTI